MKKTKNKVKKTVPVEAVPPAAPTPIQRGKILILKDLLTIMGFQLLEKTNLKEQAQKLFMEDAIKRNLVSNTATPEAQKLLFDTLWVQIQADAARNAQSVGNVLRNLK